MTFRRKVSNIIGIAISQGGFRDVFTQLNSLGKLDQKTTSQIILAICEYISENEESGHLQSSGK